jgi:hypothetical protein
VPVTNDWQEDQLGSASRTEKALLSALLSPKQSSTSSSKWNDASRVLARELHEPDSYVGGVGIENEKLWTKHHHNRRGQKGFAKVPLSVFVTDDADAVDEVVRDYQTAIRTHQGVQSALIVVRRTGAQLEVPQDQSAEHARIVALVSALDAPHLAELRDMAPSAAVHLVELAAHPEKAEPTLDLGAQNPPTEGQLEKSLGAAQCWVLLRTWKARATTSFARRERRATLSSLAIGPFAFVQLVRSTATAAGCLG